MKKYFQLNIRFHHPFKEPLTTKTTPEPHKKLYFKKEDTLPEILPVKTTYTFDNKATHGSMVTGHVFYEQTNIFITVIDHLRALPIETMNDTVRLLLENGWTKGELRKNEEEK